MNELPTIYDNIEEKLADGLKKALEGADSLDTCVGYFNLRGWRHLAQPVDELASEKSCRLLVGMSEATSEDLEDIYSVEIEGQSQRRVDNSTLLERKKRVLEGFRDQLTQGIPSNQIEAVLQALLRQLKERKVTIKLFTRYRLHAKLYLVHRDDNLAPLVGYVGSSNLTFSGLVSNGELNIDVLDQDAAVKLQGWFDRHWDDQASWDITDELIQLLEESWAGTRLIDPYLVYMKMVYHLSEDARTGVSEFRIPSVFNDQLYDYQEAAVRIAARYLNKRGGVMIGDVVGLGKTYMATALAKIRNDDFNESVLILCPPNLGSMWDRYAQQYKLRYKIITTGKHGKELADTPRHEIVLIDESHNLRNRETLLYRAVKEYIDKNESRCILLSATPYNRHLSDLGAQFGLFINPDDDIGIRPERAVQAAGGDSQFATMKQVRTRSLAAFEASDSYEDWQAFMSRYLVRRTRTFIMNNYAAEDERGRYLESHDGTKNYFPKRQPGTVKIAMEGSPYADLISDDIVSKITSLKLPRYQIPNYIVSPETYNPTPDERRILEGMKRSRMRLMGFTRSTMFKRLESDGESFLLSIKRHLIKNEIFIFALENRRNVPLGERQLDDPSLDNAVDDEDLENDVVAIGDHFENIAEIQYTEWDNNPKKLQWLNHQLFKLDFLEHLKADAETLRTILEIGKRWSAENDPKLSALKTLIKDKHPNEKILIFTQYADTARYLYRNLEPILGESIGSVIGGEGNPTAMAERFSPVSNRISSPKGAELRVLISTDVLSEGQNLQDAHIVVNFDIPWAIIRLIQRVGRVDRIGQQASTILAYSFLPDEGIENLIRLRGRVRDRLRENAGVVGTDERFFEDDDENDQGLHDLYNEKSSVLQESEDPNDVDIASYAFQLWESATQDNPGLVKEIESLKDVIHATKDKNEDDRLPPGALVYVRTNDGFDTLVRIADDESVVTESPLHVITAAQCARDTEAHGHSENHYSLVKIGVRHAIDSSRRVTTGLGPTNSIRRRVYTAIDRYERSIRGTLFAPDEHKRMLPAAMQDLQRRPLLDSARTRLSNVLQQSPSDETLAGVVISLYKENKLTPVEAEDGPVRPLIKCSMGLR